VPRVTKVVSRYVLGSFFVVAGLNHFINPDFYVRMMPPYLPWHLPLVYLSGVAEVVLGGLLLVPRWTRWAAWGLVALLIAIFPANVHMAMNPDVFYPSTPTVLLWLRLPLQGLLIAWAWWHTRQ
jgi:uncharacterized membrane protein